MKIIFIGAGNLATQLAKALLKAGHDIVQVYSRTMESASTLATLAGGAPTTDLGEVRRDADIYILAVKDSVLGDLIPSLCKGREGRVFVHTAGSMPLTIFQGMALHYGVFYPMQTFSKNRDVSFSEIPIFIESNDQLTLQVLRTLGESVSGRVYELSSQDRKYLHLASVFACNFVNHCYAVSSEILSSHHIPFDVMLPLIDETARKVHQLTPSEAQTGPAVRFDENVIRAQAALLKGDPLLKDIYERMSLSIHRMDIKKQRP
ncbi:MAG: F420-dependent NADP oxidoreductase [Prevotella sp.]|jgi:predicted short-subunit dehydrogenase-like oxidoreductase (DUF2520 family)|nr:MULTISPECIES: F420-dependent NADP oxidoreductase [unclassified Prevotella]MCH3969053.1 F420-dependent NADP oxidoreductase [Prevotella sp.]MCH3992099.1 F420-dependent NADP oxidoreductase [Prevotella sp.]MCH4017325.1 F420-dependent NADP oxidoreductase [Prevotella sp.]MCH4099703.1 F420-dependent NADP oxidoreductase [Prevotella sp.]MCH4185809.1 F420-dependent NADP oxidoreductase [Prevotella sp.]